MCLKSWLVEVGCGLGCDRCRGAFMCASLYVSLWCKTKLGARSKELQATIRQYDETSFAQAHTTHNGHNLDFDNTAIIATDPRKSNRLINDAWYSGEDVLNRHTLTYTQSTEHSRTETEEMRNIAQRRNSLLQQHHAAGKTKLQHQIA